MDELDFSIATKSGLRQRGELDALFNVTYPMVNRYLKGKAVPRGKRLARITVALATLKTLIEKGSLPFSEDKDKTYRAGAVARIVDFVNQQQPT